ncbi:MAG: D-alanyl-D-alanine carboxypeptidase family protein [Candidatus Paceibacterales bacterium]
MNKILDDIRKAFVCRWKVFVISFGLVFLMVALPMAGLKLPKLVSPVPAKADAFDKIQPKLEQKDNNFQIKKQGSLITRTYAAGDFDNAPSYAVMDFNTGEILAQKNLDLHLPIASLTKIMTAVVALDLVSPDDLFTVSDKAAAIEPTRMGVLSGQKMTLEELLNGALLTSANDAAEVIAEGVDQKYGDSVFVKAMNAKSKFLGLKDTYFTNPQGFDDQNPYSSSGDLAVLAHYALTNYPLITEIVKKDYQFLPANENHKQFDLYNWNGLIGTYPGTMGIKIGNTDAAGYTTAVLSDRINPQTNQDSKIMVVLLGAPGVLQRDMWAGELLDSGFGQQGFDPVNLTEQQLKDKYSSWQYWGG